MLKNTILKIVITTLALSSLSFNSHAKKKKQYFNETYFEVDFEITHEIIPLEIEGGDNKEIVIIGVATSDKHKGKDKDEEVLYSNAIVAIYQKPTNGLIYELLKKINLPKNTIAFDTIKINKTRNGLLILNSKEIHLLDLESSKFEKIANVSSIYLQDSPQFVLKKDLVKDLNGDGLDDIIIPDFKGVNLLLQQKDSLNRFTFSKLPVNAVVDMNGSQISFSEQSYFIQDTNFDGLSDFVLVKDGKLTVFTQKELGEFSEYSETLELPFSFSGLPWWLKRGADGETADQSNLKHRMLEGIEDINGDGVLDIMVKKTESSGVLDREISYDFFFGYDKSGVLSFDKEPNTNISAEGTLSNLQLIDMNQNNKMEILVSSFDIGVSQIIGALMSGSIDQDVFVFSLDSEDDYGEEPIFEEEVSLSFSLSSGQSGQPVIMTLDSDGNKQKDIILSVGEKRLNVFHGLDKNEESEELFSSRSKRHKTKLPADGNMVISSDLNQDGKDEIIMRYGKQDDAELKDKIVILTAK